jgi:hypothetical protein
MKNLLIYTGPKKKFSDEDLILAKIQIDNSLDLGWKKEDIILVTDFPFEYNGVKSLVVPDGLYYDFDVNANKSIVSVYLLKQNLINSEDLYWCHDFDAYENNKIDEQELGLEDFDLGLTHYTYKPEWQLGSFFLRKKSKDILELLNTTILNKPHLSRNNEKTLTKLIADNAIDSKRYKRMNVTYNMMKKYIQTIYKEALKPIKVTHFRPSDKEMWMNATALEIFMYGKNRLKTPLMSDRLIKIFNSHGIK